MPAPPISASVLNQLQALNEASMLDAVVISGPSTRTRVDLPGGEWRYEEGTGDKVTTIGKIGPLSKEAVERLEAGGIEYVGLEQLSIPKNVQVTGSDTLQVTSARHGIVTQYKVEGVTPKGTYAVSQIVIVRAV
jgi:hypothetical protein